MNEMTDNELTQVNAGEVSSDTVYTASVGVSVLALGALFTIATGGVGAPVFAVWALGVLGTGANVSAILSTQ